MYMSTHMHAHMYVYTCTHKYMYIHTCTHMYTHIAVDTIFTNDLLDFYSYIFLLT